MAGAFRAGGRVLAGKISVQLTPFQVQVSFRLSEQQVPTAAPNSTTALRLGSYTRAGPFRGDGADVGNCCVQLIPFQVQVSLSGVRLVVTPPKRTTVPFAAS